MSSNPTPPASDYADHVARLHHFHDTAISANEWRLAADAIERLQIERDAAQAKVRELEKQVHRMACSAD